MTCTDIWNRIQGHTFLDVSKILSESSMIGCIPRSGKLADGSLKEDLYYYKPELDVNLERRKKYSDVGRSARKCTMKDTQYFFRVSSLLYLKEEGELLTICILDSAQITLSESVQ